MLCDNEEGWDGVGGRRDIQEGGDICIPVIHMIHAETNTILYSNHPPIKNKLIKICYM